MVLSTLLSTFNLSSDWSLHQSSFTLEPPSSTVGPPLLSEPTLSYQGRLYHSRSRYGFSGEELGEIFSTDTTFFVLSSKGNPARVVDAFDREALPPFILGICAGRPLVSAIDLLESRGFHPIAPHLREPTKTRNLSIDSHDILCDSDGTPAFRVDYLAVKACDIISMLESKVIHGVVCYGDIWYSLAKPNYHIKPVGPAIDSLGSDDTHISLVYRAGYEHSPSSTIRIASEYEDGLRLVTPFLEILGLTETPLEFIRVSGSVEGYLLKGLCDYAITIVQSGATLRENHLEVAAHLRETKLNLWLPLAPRPTTPQEKISKSLYFSLTPPESCRRLIIEGIDGVGKTTLLKALASHSWIQDWVCYDRLVAISKATLAHTPPFEDLPTPSPSTVVVIVETKLDECDRRLKARAAEGGEALESYEHVDAQCFFRLRYRELAALCGYHVVPNNNVVDSLVENIYNILTGDTSFLLPALPSMTKEIFDGLPLVAEGESKIVRSWNSRFDIIAYKPSVYSHKQQRGGTVEGSAKERQATTRNLLFLLAKHGVPHTYWALYGGYILAERIRDVPPVEVCVKRYHVGTHKHIYYGMADLPTRHRKPLTDGDLMYEKPLVRFDWRNPNHLTPPPGTSLIEMPHARIFVNPLRKSGMEDEEISSFLAKMFPHGIPLGDFAMCEDLADEYIDVKNAKDLVRRAFTTLEFHFAAMGIRFKDVCFMPTVKGTKLYGEVSQDCGRYEPIDLEAMGGTPLDKDIWRAGGSSDLVLEKWHRLTLLIEDYVTNHLEAWYREIGLVRPGNP